MFQLSDNNLLKQQALINGQWTDNNKKLPVYNPANGKKIATVPDMGQEETRQAIHAAHDAWHLWKKKTAAERSSLLMHWCDLVLEHQEDLARLMTAEQGKPLREASGEVVYGASFIRWYAEEGKRAYGEMIPAVAANTKIMVTREPVGVVGAITPWNFPVAMMTRKVAPALSAGCTVVVKPAEDTPLSALALAELAQRAGIPAGVLNVVTTGKPSVVGEELTGNALVRKLSFTGSTDVGKQLLRQSADVVQNVSMELGGNAPFIVFDDADIEQAVQGAMVSKFRNTGQTCICANRFFVQDAVYEPFMEAFTVAVKSLSIGSGLEGSFDLGPLINSSAVCKVKKLVADALDHHATLLTGNHEHPLGGNFIEPVILGEVKPDMQCFQQEIFGPVAPVIRFHNEQDVIALSNQTRSGLAAYFYAQDLGRVFRVAEALEYGIIGVNEGLVSTEVAPFGGYKESGIGREGGRYGLDAFFELKYVLLGGLNS
ncbi:Succinate-semialdehyde dehydrogenase [NADP(+)] GabD [invertebrate metagenome]|uniref:Succinate-semialdehyde dehydrogenase [NADP(+)] GabD n=1 Tax=invertebrate metagenome TaxID=1711999 RepID=A0A2H9TA99_9ZZZZ